MHYPRLAIVDLETTGADPTRDRITEIAILITEGDTLIEQWSTLINPGMPIPWRIQDLIGISDEMVADAPCFADVAALVRQRLSEAIFVAHNVRFDYNFLRAAFEQLGESFHAPALCSVKFSRALYPQFPRHGLDAIIERHGYAISSRHRALDDAQVVWQFLQESRRDQPVEAITRAWSRALSDTPQPRLPAGDLEALPECAGVFVFRNAHGHAIEIGRSRNLRADVLGLFTSRKADARTKKRTAGVQHVETFPTAGELDALLKELQVARNEPRLKPRQEAAWGWRVNLQGEPLLQLQELSASDPLGWGDTFGCLRGELEAKKLLRDLVAKNRLCPRRLGLELGSGTCHSHALGKCLGVCAGKETAAQHDLRLLAALSGLKLRAWPYAGPTIFAEHDDAHSRSAFHVFDHWCHLGSFDTHAEAITCMAQPERRFDAEKYRLLQRWLTQPGHGDNASQGVLFSGQ
ncbi:MAG TPA: exonuclease domain-containing protein [Rhodocyclaceae bacterium]|nr:exonuclease domain-containing protein [Rhodocyclaceae bacterium]